MPNFFSNPTTNTSVYVNSVDTNAPLSFIEWKNRSASLEDKKVISEYNQYVVDWFAKNKNKAVSRSFLMRQKYLYLLSQLQLFFSDKEKFEWYSKINLADDKELLLAIPYFAKKLKAIALYYLNLRKKAKHAKLRYNLIGTEASLEQEIRHHLLEIFSSLNTELPPQVQINLPKFEDIQNTFTVEIEDLYDDSMYFDKDPSVPLSAYYDPFSKLNAEFLGGMGLLPDDENKSRVVELVSNISTTNPLYTATSSFFYAAGLTTNSAQQIHNSFTFPVTSDLTAFVNNLTSNIFEETEESLYRIFIEKFSGDSKTNLTYDSVSSVAEASNILLSAGINQFIYPSDIPIPLSSIVIENATASEHLTGADIIFIKMDNDITAAAWLRKNNYKTEETHIKANFQNLVTSFIFPYPGYGLTAEDIDWTGPSLSSTDEYPFLTNEFKLLVDEAYWNQTLTADNVVPLPLNSTTLIRDGAFSSDDSRLADKIYLKASTGEGRNTLALTDAAWLYKFSKTNIPVSTSTAKLSTLVWPLEYISNNAAEAPFRLKRERLVNLCNATLVSSLSTPFSVASGEFEKADKIYKLKQPNDYTTDAIECCWLSGNKIESQHYLWYEQGGFSVKLDAGNVVKFVWGGPDNTVISSVFKGTVHSEVCSFRTTGETDPNKCSCRQVYYSPKGHKSDKFEDSDTETDFIAVDSANDMHNFDIGSWRDSTLSGTFLNSSEFVWYKNVDSLWGNGGWVSTNKTDPGRMFTLKRGKSYFYGRAKSQDGIRFPEYVVNFQYPVNTTRWMQAKKSLIGGWQSADLPATMKLFPGDFVAWEKQEGNEFFMLSSVPVENIPRNKNPSIWSAYDEVPIDSVYLAPNTTHKNFEGLVVTWPGLAPAAGAVVDSQVPMISGKPIVFSDIDHIYYWKFTKVQGNPRRNTYWPTGTVWSTYDVYLQGDPIFLAWPGSRQSLANYTEYGIDPQYPILNPFSYATFFDIVPVLSSEVARVDWTITTSTYMSSTSSYRIDNVEYTSSSTTRLYYNTTRIGTLTFQASALLNNGETFNFTNIPPISVIPVPQEEAYYCRDAMFATFAPTTTGIFTVEVSASVMLNRPTLSEARKGFISSTNFCFSSIPSITAIPLYGYKYLQSENFQPSSGYMVGVDLDPIAATASVTSDPAYWATLNLEEFYSIIPSIFGTEQQETAKTYIDGYLPYNNPRMSEMVLNYGDVVDYYKSGNQFAWNQPIIYNTLDGSTTWCQITGQDILTLDSWSQTTII